MSFQSFLEEVSQLLAFVVMVRVGFWYLSRFVVFSFSTTPLTASPSNHILTPTSLCYNTFPCRSILSPSFSYCDYLGLVSHVRQKANIQHRFSCFNSPTLHIAVQFYCIFWLSPHTLHDTQPTVSRELRPRIIPDAASDADESSRPRR
jgi:hypothetical protein